MRAALSALYYAVVVPLGLLQRLGGRARRELSIDRGAPTYWRASSGYVDMRSPR
jgi:hypothetical protein